MPGVSTPLCRCRQRHRAGAVRIEPWLSLWEYALGDVMTVEWSCHGGVMKLTSVSMAKRKTPDPKTEALRLRRCLNPNPAKVADPLFKESDFFDPRDLVQVKYEMVRRVQLDGHTISESAAVFGLSRPSFYQAQTLLETGGLPALTPQKPGPRRSHKLDRDVMGFLEQLRSEDSSLPAPELALRIRTRFGLRVHPRSIERAFARQEKKRP